MNCTLTGKNINLEQHLQTNRSCWKLTLVLISSCPPDELFQKVAEDYNDSSFQYMTGEFRLDSSLTHNHWDGMGLMEQSAFVQRRRSLLFVSTRRTGRRLGSEERLHLLQLLPQQLTLSSRKSENLLQESNLECAGMMGNPIKRKKSSGAVFIYFVP